MGGGKWGNDANLGAGATSSLVTRTMDCPGYRTRNFLLFLPFPLCGIVIDVTRAEGGSNQGKFSVRGEGMGPGLD